MRTGPAVTIAASTLPTGLSELRQGARVEQTRFFRRWLGWTTLGEGAGFAVAAVIGVLVATSGVSGVWTYALLLAGGAVEGALLGVGQALALRALPLPRSMLRRWPPLT